MGNSRIKGLIYLIILLLLISLLASNFLCISSFNRGIGGDWNPSALSTIEVSRLPLSERGGYGFKSAIITSQTEFDGFISDITQVDMIVEYLDDVLQWQIDFSTHNLILYRHFESSGGTVVSVGAPLVDGSEVTIPLHREVLGVTDDIGYHCYAYRVNKSATSVTFLVDGKDALSFRLSEETIVSEGPALIITIEGIECDIQAAFLPLIGIVLIRPTVAYSLPKSWIIEDKICITHDGEMWETEFTEKRTDIAPWECVVRGESKWTPGTTVDLTFKLSVTYATLTTLTVSEEFSKTYTFVLNNVPIDELLVTTDFDV